MLRLSFEEMRIFLAPSRVGLVRLRRGFSRRALESVSVQSAGDGVAVITRQLEGKALQVRVFVSNHYVRLLTLPWQEALESEEEWQVFARHAIIHAFGEQAAGGRRIRTAWQGYGQNVVVAAMDEDMHAAIQAAVETKGNRLLSLEPWCMSALDLHRRALPRECWFFAAEPGMIAGMKIEGGILKAITMHPVGDDWHGGVAEAIVREMAKHDLDASLPVFLHAAVPITLDNAVLGSVKIRLLASGRDAELGIA